MKIKIYIICIIVFQFQLLFSSNVNVETGKISIFPKDVSLIFDGEKKLTIDEILTKFNDGVNENKGLNSLNFGFYDGTVWIKITLENNSKQDLKKTLELNNPNLDVIELYELYDDKYILHSKNGDFYPISERENQHRYPQFNLILNSASSSVFLLKASNHGDQFYMPITIWGKNRLVKRDYVEQSIIGVYFGIVLFVLLLNIFIYIIIGEKANFYYIFYIVGLIMLQLALGGQAYEYLWSESKYWSNFSLPIFASFSVLFLIKFTQYFLDTKTLLPKMDKLFSLFGWITLLVLLLSTVYNWTTYKIAILSINVITFVLNIIIIPTAIILVKRKYKPARFFLLAFVVLIVTVFVFILRNFGVLPSNTFTNFSLQIGSAVEVILLTFAIVDKFKLFKDQAMQSLEEVSQLKTEQNIMLEEQVKERIKEINNQKEEILEKNKEIIDSINYAKRIQNALIVPEELMKKSVPNSFVFYQPKDIVSGDFYWFAELSTTKENENNEKLYVFSVSDCTGHGVPGAFMSLIGLKILNQSIKEKNVNTPADALDFVNNQVFETINKHSDENNIVRDGMDAVLFSINFNTLSLSFAGANNPLYIVRNNELIEIKGDKQPIGAYANLNKFTNVQFQLQKNDVVYASTDGYPDQFGGVDGKKLKTRRFKEKLIECSNLSVEEQKSELQKYFNNWKGNLEQLDDICVMGIKI